MKKGRKETVICLAFLLVLYALWAVDFLYPDRLYSDWEKRMLAQRPALNRTDVLNGDYGKNYEEWLTDQFPLRDQWVSVKTRCELLLRKRKSTGSMWERTDNCSQIRSVQRTGTGWKRR